MKMKLRHALVLTILAINVAIVADAAPVTVFGQDLNGDEMVRTMPANAQAARNSFIAQLSVFVTSDLEVFPSFQFPPASLNFSGALSGTLTGNMMSSTFLLEALPPTKAGRFPTSGEIYWESAAPFATIFNAPVRAFGFFAADAGDEGGQIALSLTDINGAVSQLLVPNMMTGGAAGSVLFFGFYDVANAYTQIGITAQGSGTDIIGYDDFVAATSLPGAPAIPEPSTFVLLATGAAGIFLRRHIS
jgi:hypothetical protein